MTDFFANDPSQVKVEEAKDVVGKSFSTVDSGVYDAVIKHAYLKKTVNGSTAMHMELALDDTYVSKPTIYLTSQKGDHTYQDKKDPTKRHLLPGFIVADAIALFGAQKPISELAKSTRKMTVKIRDFQLKKDVPTDVDMLHQLIGKTIKLGIIKKIEDKKVKDDSGQYVKAGTGTREFNEIDKVFHPTSGMTVNEVKNKASEASFIDKWKESWNGKVRDESTNPKDQSAGGTDNSDVPGLFD